MKSFAIFHTSRSTEFLKLIVITHEIMAACDADQSAHIFGYDRTQMELFKGKWVFAGVLFLPSSWDLSLACNVNILWFYFCRRILYAASSCSSQWNPRIRWRQHTHSSSWHSERNCRWAWLIGTPWNFRLCYERFLRSSQTYWRQDCHTDLRDDMNEKVSYKIILEERFDLIRVLHGKKCALTACSTVVSIPCRRYRSR